MSEISLIIQPDGTILVPRGTLEENNLCMEIFQNLIEDDDRKSLCDFFAATSDSEVIFGPRGLCG